MDDADKTAPTLDVRATTPGDLDAAVTAPLIDGGDGSLAGERLGHFELLEPLGVGGMGAVWKARDLSLERTVAVKLLPAVDSRQTLERFRREARAQARMNHPNVVQIHFVGENDEHPYFAMEWVDGQSLADLATTGPVDWREALTICLQAARGLAHASERGLVHRDVKPANIMIDREGVAKVADFGIAKARDLQPGDLPTGGSTSSDALTSHGAFVGTPRYAAPEQILGEKVDERADMYALGVTLFHALTGTAPFRGTTYEVLQSHLKSAFPWETLPTDTPPRVRVLLERMLLKEPDARFATYDDLLMEMERALPQSSIPAEPPARLAAAAIDVMPLVLLLFLADGPWVRWPVFTLVQPFYLLVPIALMGQTLGQRLTKLEVVDRHGEQASKVSMAARSMIMIGGFIAFDLLKSQTAEAVAFTSYYTTFLLSGLLTSGYVFPPDLLTRTRLVHSRSRPLESVGPAH